MKSEYIEGPEAFANFERFAKTILQAPKPRIKAKKQPKAATFAQVQECRQGLKGNWRFPRPCFMRLAVLSTPKRDR